MAAPHSRTSCSHLCFVSEPHKPRKLGAAPSFYYLHCFPCSVVPVASKDPGLLTCFRHSGLQCCLICFFGAIPGRVQRLMRGKGLKVGQPHFEAFLWPYTVSVVAFPGVRQHLSFYRRVCFPPITVSVAVQPPSSLHVVLQLSSWILLLWAIFTSLPKLLYVSCM